MPADPQTLAFLAERELMPSAPDDNAPPFGGENNAPPMETPAVPPIIAPPYPAASNLPAVAPPLPLPAPVATDPRMKLALIGALGAALAGGRQSGLGGLLAGFQNGQQQADAENIRRYQVEQQLADRRAQVAAQQQRAADDVARLRSTSINAARQAIANATTKEDYDRAVENFGQSMLYAGYRDLGPNQLRVMFPFKAPSAAQAAEKAVNKALASPFVKQALTDNPGQVPNLSIVYDQNGDGVPEPHPLSEGLHDMGLEFGAAMSNGNPVLVPKGSPFEVALKNKINTFKAENRGQNPTPAQMDTLITAAQQQAAGAGGTEFDRYIARREQELGHPLSSAELVQERRRYFNEQGLSQGQVQAQDQARKSAYSAILQGTPSGYMAQVAKRLRAAGLEPEVEFAQARKQIIDFGRSILPTDAKFDFAPEQLFQLGRQTLLGQFASPSAAPPSASSAPPAAPAAASKPPAGRGAKPSAAPPAAKTMTRAELHAVAMKLGISDADAEQQAKTRGYTVQ